MKRDDRIKHIEAILTEDTTPKWYDISLKDVAEKIVNDLDKFIKESEI